MQYLSSIKIVHRDLAARNCMLDNEITAKISDFGLSKDVYETQYYYSESDTKLPIRWMAPESLEKGIYNSKTDVWSYGILVWELLTRGVTPYPSVDNWDILNYIKRGRRLPCPSHCPINIYTMLLNCWSHNPKERPDFIEMINQIEKLFNSEIKNKQLKVKLDIEYVNLPIKPKYYKRKLLNNN